MIIKFKLNILDKEIVDDILNTINDKFEKKINVNRLRTITNVFWYLPLFNNVIV